VADNYIDPESDAVGQKATRLFPIDALRGLIIVLMALDHAKRFVAQIHAPGEFWGGSFPSYSAALPFMTRLVTHLAAPGFFFLMGIGMVLFAVSRRKRGWSEWAIVGHFVARGGLLITLQLLLVNRAWELSPGGWGLDLYLGVFFALGGTMILGSVLLWLKPTFHLALTLLLALGTALLAPGPDQWYRSFPALQRLLLIPGGELGRWVSYPVLPWMGLVTFGMYFGGWLIKDAKRAFTSALPLGGAFILAFFALRALDDFGNIRPRAGDSWIDWLNVVKYPPSLTFTLMTSGVNLILLGLLAQASAKLRRFFQPLVVFGRVPLFFYLTHLFLYIGLGYLLTPDGTSIPAMVPYWLLGLLILFPLSLWYGRLKHRQPANSILRFF
jgi:uncharacterized membrane protein